MGKSTWKLHELHEQQWEILKPIFINQINFNSKCDNRILGYTTEVRNVEVNATMFLQHEERLYPFQAKKGLYLIYITDTFNIKAYEETRYTFEEAVDRFVYLLGLKKEEIYTYER